MSFFSDISINYISYIQIVLKISRLTVSLLTCLSPYVLLFNFSIIQRVLRSIGNLRTSLTHNLFTMQYIYRETESDIMLQVVYYVNIQFKVTSTRPIRRAHPDDRDHEFHEFRQSNERGRRWLRKNGRQNEARLTCGHNFSIQLSSFLFFFSFFASRSDAHDVRLFVRSSSCCCDSQR